MLFHAILSAVLIAAASVSSLEVFAPAQNSQFKQGTKVTVKYEVSDALSSGSKDIYVYIEPNHVLVHQLHAPFESLTDTFHFQVPQPGPFDLVFYDMQTAGVLQFPFVDIVNVQLNSVA
ncbi:hypothetical protein HDU83_001540 [Entophlyctis luteolus]|nr:hypothetical protein HDU83_001540 [Entophlyctis luteolus]KAJ3377183.1 hypothetical protein HDU84_008930 [Entophlyctis sp. JEL0112]